MRRTASTALRRPPSTTPSLVVQEPTSSSIASVDTNISVKHLSLFKPRPQKNCI